MENKKYNYLIKVVMKMILIEIRTIKFMMIMRMMMIMIISCIFPP